MVDESAKDKTAIAPARNQSLGSIVISFRTLQASAYKKRAIDRQITRGHF
jgi:hypothetical protein